MSVDSHTIGAEWYLRWRWVYDHVGWEDGLTYGQLVEEINRKAEEEDIAYDLWPPSFKKKGSAGKHEYF